MRRVAVVALAIVGSCSPQAAAPPPADAAAIAAAERKAVSDTDAAQRDAAVPSEQSAR